MAPADPSLALERRTRPSSASHARPACLEGACCVASREEGLEGVVLACERKDFCDCSRNLQRPPAYDAPTGAAAFMVTRILAVADVAAVLPWAEHTKVRTPS